MAFTWASASSSRLRSVSSGGRLDLLTGALNGNTVHLNSLIHFLKSTRLLKGTPLGRTR